MNIKSLILATASTALMFTSCSSNADLDLANTTEPVSGNNPALCFAEKSGQTYEIDPSQAMEIIVPVKRTAKDAATYNITTLVNDEDAFDIPSSISFAANETEKDLTIKVKSSAPTATPLNFGLGFDDSSVNPYLETPCQFYGIANLIKWNTIGTGTLYDGFWYTIDDTMGEFEVTIQQRDDDKTQYRFSNPYTDEVTGGGGTYTKNIYLTLSEDGYITWDDVFYFNTMYDYDAGQEIGAWLPSSYSTSQAQYDALSKATFNADGTIKYFTIAPYWYIDGVGGWGPKNGYNLYLLFPGQSFDEE